MAFLAVGSDEDEEEEEEDEEEVMTMVHSSWSSAMGERFEESNARSRRRCGVQTGSSPILGPSKRSATISSGCECSWREISSELHHLSEEEWGWGGEGWWTGGME